MMKGSIQRNSRAAVSSLWNSSYNQSYQSTAAIFPDANSDAIVPSSNSNAIVPSSNSNSRSNTPRSLKKSSANPNKRESVRNSTLSRFKVRCLDTCGCCNTCYDSKFVAVEPLVFMIMFAVYLHKIVFELYSFNHYAKKQLDGYPHKPVCYLTSILSNSSMLESVYGYPSKNNSSDLGDMVEDKTGRLFLTVGIASGALSILGTFFLGPFSNFFGRKGALALLTAGMFFQAVFSTIIIECELHLYFFVLAVSFRALTGNVAGMYVIAFSYVTEASKNLKKKWHSLRIGFVETISFIAVSLGFIVGGMSIYYSYCDFKVPVYLCLAFTLAAFIYSLLAAPETGDDTFAASSTSKKAPASSSAPLVLMGPKTVLQGAILMVRRGSPHFTMWLSLVVMVVTVVNSTGMSAIITLFLLNKPLSWYSNLIGVYLGVTEFVRGLVLVIVLPWLLSNGIHDITIVILSMLVTISMNVALGFVTSPWQLIIGECGGGGGGEGGACR